MPENKWMRGDCEARQAWEGALRQAAAGRSAGPRGSASARSNPSAPFPD